MTNDNVTSTYVFRTNGPTLILPVTCIFVYGGPGTRWPDIHGSIFWYLVLSDLSSVHYFTRKHWTSHFLQGTIKTGPCVNGNPVYETSTEYNTFRRTLI